MTTLDRDLLKALRADIDSTLSAIATAHGLKSLRLGNATFDPGAGSFVFKLEGLVEGGLGKDAARLEMERRFDSGLPTVGQAFTYGGTAYVATGINARATKILARRADGKVFLIPRDAVKALLVVQK